MEGFIPFQMAIRDVKNLAISRRIDSMHAASLSLSKQLRQESKILFRLAQTKFRDLKKQEVKTFAGYIGGRNGER